MTPLNKKIYIFYTSTTLLNKYIFHNSTTSPNKYIFHQTTLHSVIPSINPQYNRLQPTPYTGLPSQTLKPPPPKPLYTRHGSLSQPPNPGHTSSRRLPDIHWPSCCRSTPEHDFQHGKGREQEGGRRQGRWLISSPCGVRFSGPWPAQIIKGWGTPPM